MAIVSLASYMQLCRAQLHQVISILHDNGHNDHWTSTLGTLSHQKQSTVHLCCLCQLVGLFSLMGKMVLFLGEII